MQKLTFEPDQISSSDGGGYKMSETQRNALIALGCSVILFLVGATAWGYKTKGTDNKVYILKGVNAAGALVEGFACKCTKTGSGSTRWIGKEDRDCDSANPSDRDYPFRLIDVNEGNKPIPNGACCRGKPRIGDTVLINIADSAC